MTKKKAIKRLASPLAVARLLPSVGSQGGAAHYRAPAQAKYRPSPAQLDTDPSRGNASRPTGTRKEGLFIGYPTGPLRISYKALIA